MQGVEILNSGISYTDFGVIVITLSIVLIIIGILIPLVDGKLISGSILVFSATLALVFALGTQKITIYDVILADSVSYNDFIEKYEVIETRGKIYTVVEREADE